MEEITKIGHPAWESSCVGDEVPRFVSVPLCPTVVDFYDRIAEIEEACNPFGREMGGAERSSSVSIPLVYGYRRARSTECRLIAGSPLAFKATACGSGGIDE